MRREKEQEEKSEMGERRGENEKEGRREKTKDLEFEDNVSEEKTIDTVSSFCLGTTRMEQFYNKIVGKQFL